MEQLMLDLIPTGAKAVCHVSQNDIGRTIRFNLTSGGTAYTLAGTETIKVYIKKPDGTTAERNIANTSSTYVDWVTGEGDCDVAGKNECELVITSGTTVIGSKNFTMKVEEDPYNGQGVVIETAGPAPVATFDTNIIDLFVEIKCEINPLQNLHGYDHPWIGGAGVNIWDEETESGYINSSTGAEVSDPSKIRMKNYVKVAPSTTYFYKTPVAFYICCYDATKTFIGRVGGSRDTTFTTLANTEYIRCGFESAYGTTYNHDISINYPSSETAYYPYENICPISGFTEANIVRCGVNIWDGELELGSWDNNGEPVPTNSMYRNKRPIKCEPNTTYYTNVVVFRYYYDENFNFIGRDNSGLLTYTTPNNARWLNIRNDINTLNPSIDRCINFPSSDTSYHAYNGKTFTVQFGQTVYGGVVDVSKRKLRITHNCINLGNLNWNKTNFSEFRASYTGNNIPLPNYISDTTAINGLCECYPVLTAAQTYKGLNTGISAADDYFSVGDDNYSTAADFKTAMNNMYFAYELATPIEIDVSELSVDTLMGRNNVFHDCNGDTEVKYLYNA